MAAFSEVKAASAARAPIRVVVLKPDAFVATWENRPTTEVAIGIRCLSEPETLTAVHQARTVAEQNGRTGDAAIERYNEELMLWTVGFAACDPNDATAQWFELDGDAVKMFATPATIRHLFNELELAVVEASPIRRGANDGEISQLSKVLGDPAAFIGVPGPRATRIRQWLLICLQDLTGQD
jgi:hypothetical protein